MYSKVYLLSCPADQAEKMLEHYDNVATPAIHASENHVKGNVVHQLIQTETGKWLLVANYISEAAATAGLPLVQHIVKPMVEQFGIKLEPIGAGDVVRTI